MDSNDDLMAELKAIMDKAGESIASDQETHMVTTMKAMEQYWFENHDDIAQYALFVLQQADDDTDAESAFDPMGVKDDPEASLASCAMAYSTDEFGRFILAVTDLTATVALAQTGRAYGYATRTILEDGTIFSVLATNGGVVILRRYPDRLGAYYTEYGDSYSINAPDDLSTEEHNVLGATVIGWTLPKKLEAAFPLGFRAMAIEAVMKIREANEEGDSK